MGEPVKILDLAIKMSKLNGLLPSFEKDKSKIIENGIEIKITGLREGEKLYEELFLNDKLTNTEHPKIKKGDENKLSKKELVLFLEEIKKLITNNNIHNLKKILNKKPIFLKFK